MALGIISSPGLLLYSRHELTNPHNNPLSTDTFNGPILQMEKLKAHGGEVAQDNPASSVVKSECQLSQCYLKVYTLV